MQTIGKYQVLETIGQGGMGVVYRARDEAIGRQVALKVMRPEVMTSADARERFLREARAAGQLQHPNIVVIYDLGEDAGSPYIAMEFLSGQALDKALDAGTLTSAQKLEIFAQICDGLQYAHEAGLVHRDIKPANVMLVRNHTPKLLDFGIARVAGSQITRSTAIIGTVSYMSPEQIRGKGVDARSDIFSAGVMLYEMLSGRRPFDCDSDFDTMQAIVGQEPQELKVDGVISPDTLATIVRRALEKDPANRYQNAAEFGDAVRGFMKAQERRGMATTIVRPRPAVDAKDSTAAAVAPSPLPSKPPEPAATSQSELKRETAARGTKAAAVPSPRPTTVDQSTWSEMKPAVLAGVVIMVIMAGLITLTLNKKSSGNQGQTYTVDADTDIRNRAEAAIQQYVDPSDQINIGVKDRVVTLTGTAKNRKDAITAEHAAGVEGVVQTINNLTYAQKTSFVLSGQILDQQGAMIANVALDLKNLTTGEVTPGITDSEGRYRFPDLREGYYNLRASSQGFVPETLEAIHVTGDSDLVRNINLQVGGAGTEISVVDHPAKRRARDTGPDYSHGVPPPPAPQ